MVLQVPGFTPPPSLAKELAGKSVREMLTESGVPGYKRLQVPLIDENGLARAADILRDLAYQLSLLSRVPTGRPIDAMRSAFWEIDGANRRLSEIQKGQKRTKSGGSAMD